jgi:hypothetical protein
MHLRPDQGEIIDYNQFAARPGIVDFEGKPKQTADSIQHTI